LGNSGDVDWRKNIDQEIEYRIGEIDDSVIQKCFNLMNLMNVQYGAFDFLKNIENKYIFLEVNLSGSWVWIEEVTGQKMTSAMVDMLEVGLLSKGYGGL
jgi:glutathione synthase/RimK-type ligase-like ATP-grasp enzyme